MASEDDVDEPLVPTPTGSAAEPAEDGRVESIFGAVSDGGFHGGSPSSLDGLHGKSQSKIWMRTFFLGVPNGNLPYLLLATYLRRQIFVDHPSQRIYIDIVSGYLTGAHVIMGPKV